MADGSENEVAHDSPDGLAPYPGSKRVPRWNLSALPSAPRFTVKSWLGLLGPGLMMGAFAIGGGEWLMGPIITAKFGGGLLWLALLAVLSQLVYNIEISRYALYTGEPIFTGKFRTPPGPLLWVFVYAVLDVGMLFPYLAAAGATPLVALWRGELPDPTRDEELLRWVSIGILVASTIPLVVGGKIYNGLKLLMTAKLVFVLGFLLLVAVLFSTPETWKEILTGFVKFGNVPVTQGEDLNGNGVLDEGEDWDGDGRLDGVEPDHNGNGKLDADEDVDDDGIRDGDRLENVFVAMLDGRFPEVDLTMIALLCALVAISGGGGLGNSAISNYTRDQGWGMGAHVGAIPTIVGGHNIQLSHVGTVFTVDEVSLPRWKLWLRHVRRDQMAVWFPAVLFGVAMPCILSVQFLPRGFEAESQWLSSVFTAEAIRDHAGPQWGQFFWFGTIFCGFLVLAVSVAPATDGFVRRWIDVLWTASRRMQRLDPHSIRYIYFGVLVVYTLWSALLLMVSRPTTLLIIASMCMNFAFASTCFHTLVVNVTLLPRQLRPGWFSRVSLFAAGVFYLAVAVVSTWITISKEFLSG